MLLHVEWAGSVPVPDTVWDSGGLCEHLLVLWIHLEGGLRRVRKNDVVYTLQNGCWINVLGIISTLLGLQVGRSLYSLVDKLAMLLFIVCTLQGVSP